MQRAVHVTRGGGRRTGVIVGGRPLVPASVVPEDLISQVTEKRPCVMFSSYLCSVVLYSWIHLLPLSLSPISLSPNICLCNKDGTRQIPEKYLPKKDHLNRWRWNWLLCLHGNRLNKNFNSLRILFRSFVWHNVLWDRLDPSYKTKALAGSCNPRCPKLTPT